MVQIAVVSTGQGLEDHLQMPMKVDRPRSIAIGPPPGLDLPALKVDRGFKQSTPSPDEYSLGEEVLTLRSDFTWSPGTIKRILDDYLVVTMKDGKKNIRKDVMHFLVKKMEKSQPPPSKEVSLATQTVALGAKNAPPPDENMVNPNVALEVENARLVHENRMMHMQSQMALQEVAGQFQSQDSPSASWSSDSTLSCGAVSSGQSSAEDSSMGPSSSGGASSMSQSSPDGFCRGSHLEPELLNNALERIAELDSVLVLEPESTLSHERTTVMMRNVPNNITREELLQIFDEEGFKAHYDLLYVPIDPKSRAGLGYAFINFVSNGSAEIFSKHFQGFQSWKMQSEKICDVSWSDALQGLDEHVKRYRNSSVMHESIPDELKPVLFKAGVRVRFPEPTRRIRAPRSLIR